MIPRQYRRALRELHTRLRDAELDWALTGSLGFALQGVPTSFGDIDLQTDCDGAFGVERRFAKEVVEPVTFRASERIRSHFGRLSLGGLPVEIMGAVQKRLPDGSWEEPVDVRDYRCFVDCDGMQLPVLTLAYECRAYRLLGRLDEAERLERWLS